MSCNETTQNVRDLDSIDVIDNDDVIHISDTSALDGEKDKNTTIGDLRIDFEIDDIKADIVQNTSDITTNRTDIDTNTLDITDLKTDKVDKDLSTYTEKLTLDGSEIVYIDDNGVPKKTAAANVASSMQAWQDGYIKGGVLKTSDYLIPIMQANTQDGFVASASSFFAGQEPWEGFNRTSIHTESWHTSSGTSGWLQMLFPIAKKVIEYSILASDSYPGQAPKDWTLLGSNTGVFSGEEEIVDTRVGETGWTGGEKRTFTSTSSTTFLYYRLDATANDGEPFLGISNLDLRDISITCIEISSVKARSDDYTQNLIVLGTSLDITDSANWSGGVVPSLISATIYVWADDNNGVPRYILSDSTGSGLITYPKRFVRAFTTDSDGRILSITDGGEYNDVEVVTEAIEFEFNKVITGPQEYTLPIPSEILVNPIIWYMVGGANSETSLSISSDYLNNKEYKVAYMQATSSATRDSNTVNHIPTNNGKINYRFEGFTPAQNVQELQGYKYTR